MIWYNPPWSSNIRTPIARIFLRAIEECFPEGHPLRRYYNKHTLKASYCTMKNLSAYIKSHNRKVLNPQVREEAGCNCQKRFKPDCPLHGKCNTKDLVYQSDVHPISKRCVATMGKDYKYYFGMTKRTFKERYREHKTALNHENSNKGTSLSNFVHFLKNQGMIEGEDFVVKWSIKCRAPHYTSGSCKCLLCGKEKTAIAQANPLHLLNSMSELQKKCVHRINVELRSHQKYPP